MIQLYLVRDFGLQSTIKLVRPPIFPQLCYGYNHEQPRKKSEFVLLWLHAGNLDDIQKQENIIMKGCSSASKNISHVFLF